MGWYDDDHDDHEGFVIAYVPRDGCAPASGLYRELGYPRDDRDQTVACIAAGCDSAAGVRRGGSRPKQPGHRSVRWSLWSTTTGPARSGDVT